MAFVFPQFRFCLQLASNGRTPYLYDIILDCSKE